MTDDVENHMIGLLQETREAMGRIENRLDAMDRRFDRIEERLDGLALRADGTVLILNMLAGLTARRERRIGALGMPS